MFILTSAPNENFYLSLPGSARVSKVSQNLKNQIIFVEVSLRLRDGAHSIFENKTPKKTSKTLPGVRAGWCVRNF